MKSYCLSFFQPFRLVFCPCVASFYGFHLCIAEVIGKIKLQLSAFPTSTCFHIQTAKLIDTSPRACKQDVCYRNSHRSLFFEDFFCTPKSKLPKALVAKVPPQTPGELYQPEISTAQPLGKVVSKIILEKYRVE